MMATPRCPHCNATGIDKISAKRFAEYLLVFCGQCGAIYGVVPATQSHRQQTVKKADSSQRDRPKGSQQKNQPPTPKNRGEAEALMQFYGQQYRGTNYIKFYIPEDDDDDSE